MRCATFWLPQHAGAAAATAATAAIAAAAATAAADKGQQ